MKFSFSSTFTKLTLAAATVASIASCDDPEYPTPTPATAPSTSQGRYLVVNAAPNSGNSQLVSIDNVNVTTPPAAVPYLSTSAAYTNISAGPRLLLFSAPTNLNNQLIPARATFGTNTTSTVFLTDLPTRAASGTDLGGIRSVVLSDNLAAPAAGKAKIRFVNLATSGTYGIFVTGISPATPLFPVAPTRSSRGTTTTINGSTFNFANFIEVDARAAVEAGRQRQTRESCRSSRRPAALTRRGCSSKAW